MTQFFGFPSRGVAIIGLAVATLLVLIVGMLIIGSSAIRALMAPGLKVDDISLLALLLTIIVLLLAILVILIVLFWCSCRRGPGKEGAQAALPPDVIATIIPLAPVLRELPNHLSRLGITVYQCGKGIQWIDERIRLVGDQFGVLSTAAGGAVERGIPQLITSPGDIFTKFDPNAVAVNVASVREIAGSLSSIAATIAPMPLPRLDFQVPLLGTPTMGEVGGHMVTTGTELLKAAKRMGATNPPPPPELAP
jgi:hypothetical protein